MSELRMGAIESRFADMIWQNEPITSPELVKLAAKELDWKKSTTYTMLRRLCERGLFCNEEGMVRSLISKEAFQAKQSEKFVEEVFAGSLPQFLTAFSNNKRLSEKEVAALQALIDNQKEGK